jgi:PAS domain S-box-containing protein
MFSGSQIIRAVGKALLTIALVSAAYGLMVHYAVPQLPALLSRIPVIVWLGLLSAAPVFVSWLGRAGNRQAATEEACLAAAIEQAAEGIVITDTGAGIRYVNPAFTRMTGYSAEEAIGQNPRLLKSGQQNPAYYKDLWETISKGRIWHGELVNRRKNGSLYTEEMTITPVRDDSGAVVNYIAIKQDVTDRRAAEEAGRFLASIVESSSDAIIGTSLDGNVVSWNDGAAAMFGYGTAEVLGKHISMLAAGAHAEELRRVFAGIRNGDGTSQHETVQVRKDGTTIDVSVTVSPIRNATGEVTGVAAIARDISRRKRAESELRASEENYRVLFERNLAAVLRTTLDGRVLECNDATVQMLGYASREQVLATNARDYYFDAADREAVMSGLRAQRSIINRELKLRRADGSLFWGLANFVLVEGANAGDWVVASTVVDLTARKKVEDELKVARDAAEAASQAKSAFLANMSHEIRTPMNAVIGMTELTLDMQLSADVREYLEIVKTSAESLMSIIDDVLDFSRIEARKLDLECIAFNLNSSMEIAIKALRGRAQRKNLELVYQIHPDIPPVVIGDPGRLRQILLNLVGNAIKFTERGKVVVEVEKSAETAGQVELHFSVSDTGIGIPTEKRQAIFEAFVQADVSSTRRFGGTGLGLAITSELIHMMGGKIWLESEPGLGSTFHFSVSLRSVDQPTDVPSPAHSTVLENMPVLAVDDNETNLRILREVLAGWGMKPALAGSAHDAMISLKQASGAGTPYRLVIVDAQMPGMDGFTLIERIQQDPELTGAPIMMLTSAGQRGDAARSRDIGVSAYLTKPIGESELLDAVLRVLNMSPDRTGRRQLITRHTLREPRKGLRILIVEDNLVNQHLAVRLVEKQGHAATTAANGREALEALANGLFDLVLMDIQMPEMDGFEATRAIRQNEKATGAHLPVIAMTAHTAAGDREQCLQAGMDAYVSKPIRVKELFAAIESVAGPVTSPAGPPLLSKS